MIYIYIYTHTHTHARLPPKDGVSAIEARVRQL